MKASDPGAEDARVHRSPSSATAPSTSRSQSPETIREEGDTATPSTSKVSKSSIEVTLTSASKQEEVRSQSLRKSWAPMQKMTMETSGPQESSVQALREAVLERQRGVSCLRQNQY